MSTSCPQCSTKLKDDYGMVTCPGCSSIVFVDMDGVAQVASDTPPASTPIEESTPYEEPAPIVEPMALQTVENSDIDMNAFLGYAPEADTESGGSVEMPPAGESSSHFDPADPLGLSAYANSEISAAKNGPLVVTLTISGIDAKDLRNEIRQALQDSRFGWDAAALMSSIKGGVLRIEQVSPVKATIIINRIKNLSVRIKWEQSAITEIDPTSKE